MQWSHAHTWPCCYTPGDSYSDSSTCVLCPLPQWKTPEWWLYSQQKKGCAFLLTFPAPCHQQWTPLCSGCAVRIDAVFGPSSSCRDPNSQQPNAQLSYLHIFTLTPNDGLDKHSSRTLVLVTKKKKSPSVNSNQFSIVAKLSRSAVYLKMYLTSPSSSTEAQPQVFSTSSCCFYLLAFSNVSFCHRPGLCALRISYRVNSWYAGVTSLMWGRNGRECLVSQKAALRSSGARWVVSSCPQPSAANWNLFWYLDGDFATSLTLMCVCGSRCMDPLIHSASYSVKTG